ncbi:MAG: LL-diaminopimelate aminotransferase [Nitrospirae bacterium]|nr:LL-diaminopimelate aminotransferase [Nitrospirota bacterium]
MEDTIQNLFAGRIGGSRFGREDKIYKFEKIKRAKTAALKANPGTELIDLGVGEPDDMAPPGIVDTMQKECAKWENRGYADNGIAEFKEAAARYMESVYAVKGLDPGREIIHGIGSKPALAMLPSAFVNHGDITLMTVPGYPVMGTHTKWYGGEVVNLPLQEENDFLPDLDSIGRSILDRAKLLYLNYPNNPTGGAATQEFFEKVVRFASDNNIIVVHDAAYAALNFEGKPLSFLSIPGAKEVGIEIHSLSKAFNMTGWRIAFVAGNEKVVNAYGFVKDNYDSGQFKAIQKAGAYALDNASLTTDISRKYERRLNALVETLNSAGFSARMPKGSFYLYVKIPKRTKSGTIFNSAEDFSEFLIKDKLISSVPWDDAGSYVRFSATFIAKDLSDETRILNEVRRRLSDTRFEF